MTQRPPLTDKQRTEGIALLKRMLRRAKKVKAESEQYCRDIAHWNEHVRQPDETPLIVERDMATLGASMEGLIKQIDIHLAEFDEPPAEQAR